MRKQKEGEDREEGTNILFHWDWIKTTALGAADDFVKDLFHRIAARFKSPKPHRQNENEGEGEE